MKQIKTEKGVKGELARVYFHGRDLLLIFSDDCFAYFHGSSRYNGDVDLDFEPNEPDDYLLKNAGLLTEKEFAQRREAEKAKWDQETRKRELDTLARLKAKYE